MRTRCTKTPNMSDPKDQSLRLGQPAGLAPLQPRRAPHHIVFSFPSLPIQGHSAEPRQNTDHMCRCQRDARLQVNSAAKQDFPGTMLRFLSVKKRQKHRRGQPVIPFLLFRYQGRDIYPQTLACAPSVFLPHTPLLLAHAPPRPGTVLSARVGLEAAEVERSSFG